MAGWENQCCYNDRKRYIFQKLTRPIEKDRGEEQKEDVRIQYETIGFSFSYYTASKRE